jgi:leucyl aminopeptidase
MQFNAVTDPKARSITECAVVGVFDNGELGAAGRHLDKQMAGRLQHLCAQGDISGKLCDSLLLFDPQGTRARRVMLIGLGSRSGFGRKQYRKAVHSAATALLKTGAAEATVYLAMESLPELDTFYRARIAAEAFCTQTYKVADLKTGAKPKQAALLNLRLAVSDARAAKSAAQGLAAGSAVGNGMSLSRDLANLPPNICTPRYLASRALHLAKEFPRITTRIFDEGEIKALKMGSFLAVARGSDEPPRLIVCEYKGGRKGGAPVCLVGKGITFDSGGISLKDPAGMDEMKFDMSGAAAVLGTLQAAAELKLPINIVGVIAACENLPSGRALKPSDIVTTMSGQTVEVLNTDAEGRLILCDAITFARRFKPDTVIDVATLTGACIVALGNQLCGLMSNDDELARELESASLRADDRAWRLPIGEEYVEQLKSNFADIANVGGREGGACTAASFLSKFAKDLKWAHLDVAGTAWLSGANKGSTGRPVPMLVDFLLHRAGFT